MLIKEFRIVLPLSVEEYQVGQLHTVVEASKNETGGGEGVEIIQNEPFENVPLCNGRFTKGQYTYKIYHVDSKIPGWIRMLFSKSSLEIHEKAWNAYPYCKTVLTNPHFMKDDFTLTIETIHCPDRGEQENAHELPEDKLKEREVIFIDIAKDVVDPKDYKESEDPSKFHSALTGRGPLDENWQKTINPYMCCYKLVTVHFKWRGLQNRVEALTQRVEQRLFFLFHRQLFCSLDKWYGMDMLMVRELEERTKKELDEQRANGKVQGRGA